MSVRSHLCLTQRDKQSLQEIIVQVSVKPLISGGIQAPVVIQFFGSRHIPPTSYDR